MSILLVSVLIGAFAAAAATAICTLTSATLTPLGGALLGAGFGLTAGNLASSKGPRSRRILTTIARAFVAGGTAALVIALLQR